MKLDAKTVAGLKLSDGKPDAIHFDDSLPGFGLRASRQWRQGATVLDRAVQARWRHATDAAGFCRSSDRRSGAGGGEEDPCGDCLGARPAG